MAFVLDDYIKKYIEEASDSADKTTAQHLKEIIPNTSHMDKRFFNEIIEGLKKEMEQGENFKTAFFHVCKEYTLTGDIITTKLPNFFIRIYLSRKKFLLYIKKEQKIPYGNQKIGLILASRNKDRINRLLGKIGLSKKKVVFATFGEGRRKRNPFLNCKVIEIVNMLALNKDVYEEGEPYTAVKIKYKNKKKLVKRYPTFIDAGWYDKFFPSGKEDNYGRTRSLDPSLPDMPEIVHENIKMRDVIVDIEFLGD